ncbi:histone deacetylase family protein [Reichenbachiella versicolor]|uniref:histone deacetylase family protein n=1 Tax=Reichenbachiella versicolor TaxID=1821036 RepID=UPI000D6EA26B|nr:histone deacetylase [Reichenbachiella versicolor]
MLKVAWSKKYCHPLPENHRFPMIKYELLPQQLLHEGTIEEDSLFEPRDAFDSEIICVHTEEYWRRLRGLDLTASEIRKTGFPLSKELVDREINIAGGTIQCVDFALKYGMAMNIAGGTHHAFSDRGEGFCLLNDQAIASMYLIENNLVDRVLVLDLDVHQGNGSAEIFHDNDQVFTFSMHGEKNYPMHKEQSDLDIGLADGCADELYLSTLQYNLSKVVESFKPEFVFYQSGVDILSTDKLGRLDVTIEGCKERDRMVLQYFKSRELPLVACMGGGYSQEIKLIIESHANTFRLAQEIYF